MCESLSREPYAQTKEWQTMLKHHEHVHLALKQYVSLSQEDNTALDMENILNDIQLDTQNIFKNLNQVIDNYKG